MVKFNAKKTELQQELENLDHFDDNIQQDLLDLKQIGLLEIEQPYQFVKSFSPCGDAETVMQHLQELFRIIREIYRNKKRMDDLEKDE